MSTTIPTLSQLPDYGLIELDRDSLGRITTQLWQVPLNFVPYWLQLHGHDEQLAQDHWEQNVVRILGGAKAVGRGTDRATIRRAVTATLTVLCHPETQGRCPVGAVVDHYVTAIRLPADATDGRHP